MPSFNSKLSELKNVISEKKKKDTSEKDKWNEKFRKIIHVATEIYETGYTGFLEFFIPNADKPLYCKVDHGQSRGAHLEFRIEIKESGIVEISSDISTGPKPVYYHHFKEHMAFGGDMPVTFESHTEALLDYILESIKSPEYIQNLIDEVKVND